MEKSKNILLFSVLYFSLLIGFIYGENLNYGSYYDWINAYVSPINSFSNDFFDTLLNYEKFGQRHSPVYIIFLSLFKRIGLDLDLIRLINLHLSLSLIFIFYNCLRLKFKNTDKLILQTLSLVIFLSPTFRSLSIWPDSRLPGLIFFTLAIYFFLRFSLSLNKKNKFALLCSTSIIMASYVSPNFSLFSIFFYYVFFKELRLRNFLFLLLVNFIAALPMIYYVFILDVNFITAGKTLSSDGTSVSLDFNFSNKILIIGSIFFFHLFPLLAILLDKEKIISLLKKKILHILLVFSICIYFFDYQMNFSGGGVFFQLSQILFGNNVLFFILSFLSLTLIIYLAGLHKYNFYLILLLILSNVQNTIYHKYYEPLIIIVIFLLFKNSNLESFFSKKTNLLFFYLFNIFYILMRTVKNVYLV